MKMFILSLTVCANIALYNVLDGASLRGPNKGGTTLEVDDYEDYTVVRSVKSLIEELKNIKFLGPAKPERIQPSNEQLVNFVKKNPGVFAKNIDINRLGDDEFFGLKKEALLSLLQNSKVQDTTAIQLLNEKKFNLLKEYIEGKGT